MNNAFHDVPVVILCGGKGVVLGEGQDQRLNKALVSVHHKPLFHWVIEHYRQHGARQFMLAVGLQPEGIRQALLTDCGAKADEAHPDLYHLGAGESACQIRLVATPEKASTAQRLMACKPFLEGADRFALTYSDTLSNVDLAAELAFHRRHGSVATLVSTQCPVRFRILGIRQGENIVRAFAPKPVIEAASINGGYYLFTQAIWDPKYGMDQADALESLPLEKLAAAGQLTAYEHRGAWQHCDAERDLAALERLAAALAPGH